MSKKTFLSKFNDEQTGGDCVMGVEEESSAINLSLSLKVENGHIER